MNKTIQNCYSAISVDLYLISATTERQSTTNQLFLSLWLISFLYSVVESNPENIQQNSATTTADVQHNADDGSDQSANGGKENSSKFEWRFCYHVMTAWLLISACVFSIQKKEMWMQVMIPKVRRSDVLKVGSMNFFALHIWTSIIDNFEQFSFK